MNYLSFYTQEQALAYIEECRARVDREGNPIIGCCMVKYNDHWYEVRTWDL